MTNTSLFLLLRVFVRCLPGLFIWAEWTYYSPCHVLFLAALFSCYKYACVCPKDYTCACLKAMNCYPPPPPDLILGILDNAIVNAYYCVNRSVYGEASIII